MDNQQILQLAKAECFLQLDNTEYFNKQLNDWLNSLSEDFGEDTHE